MRGRKPKPDILKKLAGNPGKRKLKNLGKVRSEIPDRPAHLNAEAVAEWDRIAPLLAQMGLLSNLDRANLAAYCLAWSRWVEAEKELEKGGTVVKSPNGYPIQNPYLAVANQAAKQMQSLGSEFGLSPSARSRLDVQSQSQERDDFSDFLKSSMRKSAKLLEVNDGN